jgi:hypothetical protein
MREILQERFAAFARKEYVAQSPEDDLLGWRSFRNACHFG